MTTIEISKAAEIKGEPAALATEEITPSKYLALLEEKKFFKEAIAFLAYGVAPPVAVQWGSQCLREFLAPSDKEANEPSLGAVDAWLKEPTDENRHNAKAVADKNGGSTPSDLLALAVFFSGGSITPPDAPVTPPPPGVTAKMTAGSIQVAIVSDQPQKMEERYGKAIALGRTLAQAAPETNFAPA